MKEKYPIAYYVDKLFTWLQYQILELKLRLSKKIRRETRKIIKDVYTKKKQK